MGAATTTGSRRSHGGLGSRLRIFAYLAPGMTGFLIFMALRV